jgi:NAD(P)-dependent dehydrogenase (short-subunit alcohol dehydrogenase family)
MTRPAAPTASAAAPSMAGRVVLITGATGGIGKATAIGLAALGAQVAITGRDLGRTEAAAVEIRRLTRNPDVRAFGADLSVQADVRRLGAEVLAAYPRLDVLVNNVGGSWATRHVTPDGIEHTFAVNHLAAFLLTNLLLDRLRASAPARVVNVASAAQSSGEIDFADLQAEHGYSERKAYPQAKLASVMFTYELARRLDGSGVTATVLHPGVVNTAFGAEDPGLIFKILVPLMRPFMKTPAQGARTSIYLASSPAVQGVSGVYFADSQPKQTSERSYDEAVAARLWRASAELVGLPT